MLLSIELRLTFGISPRSSLIAEELSRAVTERAGGAFIEPMVAASILAALDSIPTSKIKAVGGQDGLRETSSSLFRKSCPQPLRNNVLYGHVCLLEQAGQDGQGGEEAASPQRKRGRRLPPPTPYTDRGVEIRRIKE